MSLEFGRDQTGSKIRAQKIVSVRIRERGLEAVDPDPFHAACEFHHKFQGLKFRVTNCKLVYTSGCEANQGGQRRVQEKEVTDSCVCDAIEDAPLKTVALGVDGQKRVFIGAEKIAEPVA